MLKCFARNTWESRQGREGTLVFRGTWRHILQPLSTVPSVWCSSLLHVKPWYVRVKFYTKQNWPYHKTWQDSSGWYVCFGLCFRGAYVYVCCYVSPSRLTSWYFTAIKATELSPLAYIRIFGALDVLCTITNNGRHKLSLVSMSPGVYCSHYSSTYILKDSTRVYSILVHCNIYATKERSYIWSYRDPLGLIEHRCVDMFHATLRSNIDWLNTITAS